MNNIKIAFHMMGGESWAVGPIYLRNLFYALRQRYGRKLGMFLLSRASRHDAHDYAHSIEADEVIYYDLLRRWSLSWIANKISKRLLSRDMAMERVLKRHRIDIIFGSIITYKYDKIPTLSWLPDFQHIHLPEMFSDAERRSRDRIFLRTAELSTRIILMSNAVKKDFDSFAPMYAHKVRVLHPVSYIPQSIYDSDLNSVLHLYHLPEKFIYLPNQFWRHKNHELVFQSVKILEERGKKIFIVCTGSPPDYRHPTYFADLFQKLSQWNIRGRIIYLGLIPHEHVLLLIRQSICVLNPSLFEGYGVTVDEARSVGKQVLLSDIPAHREQNPPKATFFDPKNPEDLAGKLAKIWQETPPGPDFELERKARQIQPKRIHNYAESFMSVVNEVINE